MAGRFSVEAVFKATDLLSPTVKKINAGMGKLGQIADGFGAKVKSAAKMATVAVVGLGGALALAAKPGMDFEEAITAVGAVSLMTRKQVGDLEKKALELGASTVFSATEVANAMEMMGRAGFTNQQVLEGVGGVLNAAAAEGAGLAETASHISNVLKGMGLEATESGRVADVLTLASARTNSSISSLGESMKNVASTARTFNVPMEDTVAAVALLQDVGIDASEAGSAVNTMLTQMAAPTKDVAAKMKKLGISFKDSKGNMLPLTKVFEQFQKASDKSGGNMEQVAFFADLVGLRGQKAAVNLKDLFKSGKFGELSAELRNAAGSAEEMAKLRLNNFKGDMEQLGGAIEGVQIGLFNMQTGPLRGIVQGMTKWIEANGALIQSKVGDYLRGLITVAENAKFAFDLFTHGVKEGLAPVIFIFEALAGPAGKVGDSLGTWPAIIARIGQATGVLIIALGVIKTAQGLMFLYTTATMAAAGAKKFLAAETTKATLATIYDSAKTVINTGLQWARVAAHYAVRAALVVAAGASAIYTGATTALTTATVAAEVAFGPLLVTLGAVALAVGALIALYLSLKDLMTQTGGMLGAWEGIKSTFSGDGFFAGVDADMNRKAKEEAAKRNAAAPQVVSPQERTAAAITQNTNTTTTNKSELTIKDQTGKAAFTKAPPKGVGIVLAPSGGM